MRKNILYIRQNIPGGTDNYCKTLYHLLKDDRELHPLPIEDLPTIPSRLFHYYYKVAPLREAIQNTDIVHINGYTAMGSIQAFVMAHRLHKKIVYTAHWHPFYCLRHPILGKLFFSILFRPLIKKWADTITTINNEDTRFFQAFHSNVVQIPHCLKPKTIRRKQHKTNLILFVGRIDDPVKGIEHLYHLPNEKYEIHCVGKGLLSRKDFHQHINISDEDLAFLYAEAALLVIPSKYEAFSYAALEALSYGTPVLMSERVRIADYLQDIQGYQVFKYGDYDDFAQKVQSTIGMTVDTESVIRKFSPDVFKEKYRSLYLHL